MGHELSHAFDDRKLELRAIENKNNNDFLPEGREYDKTGNLNEWWDPKTIDSFKKKMTCFQDQYSKFQIGKDHASENQMMTIFLTKKVVSLIGFWKTDGRREHC